MFTALALAASIAAGTPPPPAARPITPDETKEVVQRLEQALRDVYVFPETGEKTAVQLAEHLAAGAYDRDRTSEQLSDALTADLRAVAHDKHLAVWFEAPGAPQQNRGGSDPRVRNYGVQKVEHLAGNVGYMDLREFDDPEAGAATISGAMNLLANSDAVIIDLRSNGGGKPSGVQFVASYFFGDSQHLTDIYHRQGNVTDQYWTLPVVEGKRMPDMPLYLLTSSRTFSGGEGFAYNLQALHRATVVGEVTGGGANPGRAVPLADGFVAFIPNGRAINPVTHTNWEGTGVRPDIEVAADQAFDTAYLKALEAIEAHAKTAAERDAASRAIAAHAAVRP